MTVRTWVDLIAVLDLLTIEYQLGVLSQGGGYCHGHKTMKQPQLHPSSISEWTEHFLRKPV